MVSQSVISRSVLILGYPHARHMSPEAELLRHCALWHPSPSSNPNANHCPPEDQPSVDYSTAGPWYRLAEAGGGTVHKRVFTPNDCYSRALGIDAQSVGGDRTLAEDLVHCWLAFGRSGGGKVLGRIYTQVACYQTALDIDPRLARGWFLLGRAGGGDETQKACYRRALELDPDDPEYCYYLAVEGGGMVGGRNRTAAQCLAGAIERMRNQKHQLPRSMIADCWHRLGMAGGDRHFSRIQCHQQVLEVDFMHLRSWREIARLGGVDLMRWTAQKCIDNAQKLYPYPEGAAKALQDFISNYIPRIKIMARPRAVPPPAKRYRTAS